MIIIASNRIWIKINEKRTEISLLVFWFMHFYKKYVPLAFCSQLLLFWAQCAQSSPAASSLFFSYIVFDLFYTDLIRLTLFLAILLLSNFWIRRYRYSSLMLNPIIIRLNITSTAV